MTKFEQFEKAFDEKYEEDIYKFIDEFESDNSLPFGGKLEQDLDEIKYDSYGSENSQLGKIFYFADFDIYIKFYGTRQSYAGEEWDGYKEVIPTTKIIRIFEEIKK